MSQTVIGALSDEYVIVKDKKAGSRLYNRGQYGTPLSGGGLQLELIEGFYLLDSEKIQITKNHREIGLEELLTYITKREPTFEIKYIVYRDLRLRGHIVKPSNLSDFVIYGAKAGSEAGKRKIKYWSLAVSERARFNVPELGKILFTTNQMHKELLIGVVDEEGDLTYYHLKIAKPKGKLCIKKIRSPRTGSAVLVEDRVMLWEPELIKELRAVGFYGKMVGKSLQLALTESVYLMENGIIDIRLARTRRKVSLERFLRIARDIQPDFDLRLKVYKELKSRNLIVKTGFKYGTHFRVYEGDPESDHSEYLVHGVPNDYDCSWEEISRAVRLAQGVRKQMLFGRVLDDKDKIEYFNVERIKP
ncbi:tRNA-intron lyase [[Eubacterium] cellulosolvens]